jgi:hypothetical protein
MRFAFDDQNRAASIPDLGQVLFQDFQVEDPLFAGFVLGRKLGVKLVNDDADVQVVVDSRSVYIAHLDMALTTIINKCQAAGLRDTLPVSVFYNGRLVATVDL